ncbi:MAG TPA: hypothetical protein VD978_22220 [Azospirillum sp.]|nr:hypothetical protein [Azospirillum sp.]
MHSLRLIEACADLSVRRGCGFGGLAIAAVMVGLSFDPLLSVETGAILSSLMACILLLKAGRAPHRSHKTTELWIMLDEDKRPAGPHAQRILMTTLKDAYLRYARFVGFTSAGLWAFSLGLMIAA